MRLARLPRRADETNAVPTRLRPVLAALLALAAVAAGCGSAPEGEASGLTRQQYVVRADTICNRMLEDAKSLRGRSPEQQLKQVLAIQGRMIERLRTLTPPAGDEQAVGDVLRNLERLQAATKAFVETEDEEVLGAAAGIAVEMDAVDQASRRYGLFRRCGAFRVSPALHKLIDEPTPKPKPPPPVRPAAPTGDLPGAARALVPRGSRVLSQEDCGGGGVSFCVTISLDPGKASVTSRRAAYLRRALQGGWREITPDDGPKPGLLLLRRGDREEVVWITSAACPQGVGDGPAAAPRRCADTIMVHGSL
jgi:cytochrome c556